MQTFFKQINLNEPLWSVSTGQNSWQSSGSTIISTSPIDNSSIAAVNLATVVDYENTIQKAKEAFLKWRTTPAPQRGEIVRQMGEAFREHKQSLGDLVSLEMGKSLQEGLGEVQEIIDICDFATGLSRQLYGLSMHSERPLHRMMEQWHPLGVVGVISAFNFPVAVWAWNATLAWICGNTVVWKPSELTPLTALACQQIILNVLKNNNTPEGLSCVIVGDSTIGQKMAEDTNINLLSATGSTRMGKEVAVKVAARLGKSLLELGGNNAIIISPEADRKLYIPAVVFGAVGTAGQRCTTTRRLIVHSSIVDQVCADLCKAYTQIKIGNPLEEGIHMGPLVNEKAVNMFLETISDAQKEGAELIYGGKRIEKLGVNYVEPTIIKAKNHYDCVQKETFAPILYVMSYETLDEAIHLQNDVPQGLSSAIFSKNIKETEQFLSAWGSDCGIANVNIGTSGAEIGGAFGGEKETGGGRESGSDAWKTYMRRQTNTINFGDSLPLAQGIKFEF
jgi:aldehyde dehydrogenase (NAD+)